MTSYALNPQDKDVVFSYQCGLRDPMAFGKGDDAGWLKCGDIVGMLSCFSWGSLVSLGLDGPGGGKGGRKGR